jgi:glutathione S-transferase
MKLYSHPGSCSSASHLALIESGVDFEFIPLNLMSDRKIPDGRTIDDLNPKGYVPVLELDSGKILTENPVILQTIGDANPDANLAPSWDDKEARMELIAWLGFIGTEIHKGVSPLMTPNLSDENRAAFNAKLNKRFEYLDKELANKTFLMGEQFTVADCYMFIVLGWKDFIGFDFSSCSNLVAYVERIAARDSVKTYLEQAGPYLHG